MASGDAMQRRIAWKQFSFSEYTAAKGEEGRVPSAAAVHGEIIRIFYLDKFHSAENSNFGSVPGQATDSLASPLTWQSDEEQLARVLGLAVGADARRLGRVEHLPVLNHHPVPRQGVPEDPRVVHKGVHVKHLGTAGGTNTARP